MVGRAGAAGERADARPILHQRDEPPAEGVEERVAGAEQFAARVVVAEPPPEPLDRVGLGAVRRQEPEDDVGRHRQIARPVPAGVIDHQHDALAGSAAAITGVQERPPLTARTGRGPRAPTLPSSVASPLCWPFTPSDLIF